jgi:CheY-like chemotaxis protein
MHPSMHDHGNAVAATIPPSPPVRGRILIVDDNADAADLLKIVLLSLGFAVEVAYDGTAGLALANAFEPELVLCDLTMPGMHGYAVAETLRAHPRLRGLHLVALTGWNDRLTRQAAQAAGFDTHIVKPASYRSLHALLEQRFGRPGC